MVLLAGRVIAAHRLDDDQLRRELAQTHELYTAVQDLCTPPQRRTLQARLEELNAECQRRFAQRGTS